jgi:hypothetical protein
MVTACVNPAALAGGAGELRPYLSNGARFASPGADYAWVKGGAKVETPYVVLPGMLAARCAEMNGAHVLAVTVKGDPADPRVDDITGDLPGRDGRPDPKWGMHMVDMNLTMGNLVEVVGRQRDAWLARK